MAYGEGGLGCGSPFRVSWGWGSSRKSMQVLRESTLSAYARHFWARQSKKCDPNDREALADICDGGDPVKWLKRSYDYKLPRIENDVMSIVRIETRQEVESLLVHDYVPRDRWMSARNLVPEPYTRRLGQLARTSLDRGYFTVPRPGDRPYQYFCAWSRTGSLANAIGEDRPLIETVVHADGLEYEIVDGWGRLLPFAALLHTGLALCPFESFLASRPQHLVTDEGDQI